MKVKYIKNEENLWLEYWKIYNVFAVVLWKNSNLNKIEEKWEKFYIKPEWPKYIYPYDIDDFEILDDSLMEFWWFWKDNSWYYYLWPKELYQKSNFFYYYYNDYLEYITIINKYLNN